MAHPRLMARALAALGASVVLATGGCAAASPTTSGAATPAQVPVAVPATIFETSKWGRFHSARFELSLNFPDGAAWVIDDHRSEWLSATHGPTHSRLRARSWTEGDLATRSSCYARARSWDATLPEIDAVSVIDDRLRILSSQLDTRVVVGVLPAKGPHEGVTGFAVAVGASIRRCLVIAYRTLEDQAVSGGAELVAGRLAIVSEGVIESLRLDDPMAPARAPLRPRRTAPLSGGPS